MKNTFRENLQTEVWFYKNKVYISSWIFDSNTNISETICQLYRFDISEQYVEWVRIKIDLRYKSTLLLEEKKLIKYRTWNSSLATMIELTIRITGGIITYYKYYTRYLLFNFIILSSFATTKQKLETKYVVNERNLFLLGELSHWEFLTTVYKYKTSK